MKERIRKKLQQSNGITLVALVVTIVVLLILAGVSLNLVLGNNGIVKKAQDAREKTIEDKEREQVALAYDSATIKKLGGIVEASDLQYELDVSVGVNKTLATGQEVLNVLFYETGHNYSVENGTASKIEDYKGLTITTETDDVIFTKADGTEEGNPDQLENGDIVKYGKYEYAYKNYWYYKYDPFNGVEYEYWQYDENQTGWGVRAIEENINSTDEICGTIYGKPVTTMTNTFYDYRNLTSSPKIPNSVTDMYYTFSNCIELIEAPVIPNSVINMKGTFSNCQKLAKAPIIPNSVINMDSTFSTCLSLIEAPAIPDNVVSMRYTFDGCRALTEAPVIPDSVTDMTATFQSCSALTEAPAIPDSVTDVTATFQSCTSLTKAPVISNSVTRMNDTFRDCRNLIKAPIIPEKVDALFNTFESCTKLTEAPAIPDSVTIMNYTFEDCISLIEAPVIPNNVTSMDSAFAGCRSLIKAPIIPEKVTNLNNTFSGCTSLTTPPPTISENVMDLRNAFKNCKALSGQITIAAYPKYQSSSSWCWDGCFSGASTNSGTSLVISGTSGKLTELLSTKSSNSNISIR